MNKHDDNDDHHHHIKSESQSQQWEQQCEQQPERKQQHDDTPLKANMSPENLMVGRCIYFLLKDSRPILGGTCSFCRGVSSSAWHPSQRPPGLTRPFHQNAPSRLQSVTWWCKVGGGKPRNQVGTCERWKISLHFYVRFLLVQQIVWVIHSDFLITFFLTTLSSDLPFYYKLGCETHTFFVGSFHHVVGPPWVFSSLPRRLRWL